MKMVFVTVAVHIKDEADVQDVVSEMNYSLVHKDIVGTEIVDIEEVTKS